MENPRTINLRSGCDLRLWERNESKVTNARWKTTIEHKVSQGRLSAAFGSDNFVKVMWKRYAAQKRWARQMEGATKAVLQETSSWQEESPHKKELGLFCVSSDMRLDGTLIRQASKAGKAGDWSEIPESDRHNAWTSAKLQECSNEVKQDDDEPKSIVQQILQKGTDFVRRIIVPVEGQEMAVTLSYVCPECHRCLLEDHIWWCQRSTRSSATGGVVHAAASTSGGIRTIATPEIFLCLLFVVCCLLFVVRCSLFVVCLFACLLVCLFACLLVCLFACLLVCLFACVLVCLCACVLVCLCACVLVCLCACVLVCLCACVLVCLCACVLVCLCACVLVCLCACVLVCLCACVLVCLCACVLVCLCACVLVCLCACVLVCLCACVLVCLCACVLVCLCACVLVCLFACLLVCLFACLLVCLFACLLVCLFACLLVCLFAVCCLLLLTRAVASKCPPINGRRWPFDRRGMSNAKAELDGGSSTDGRASRKSGHHRYFSRQNVCTRTNCRRCQTNIPPVSQSVSTKWSQLVGIVIFRWS